ncbi:PASTA domain-containing protein [Iamia sp.]|uniref:PASTA domain-containing protein n=1 Tax=Iamia sp. TaxID=2722710 RepID=UPI002CA5336F|nr:PASTA domain-containing protein [Iamia sp.]HXH58878.1 PASTA domain-containing protein [Iamia sp.]
MTDPHDPHDTDEAGDDAAWFRAAVDPVLDAHRPSSGWAAVRRRLGAEEPSPLVVALVPPRRRGRERVVLTAAAVAVLAGIALALLLVDRDGSPDTDRRAGAPETTDRRADPDPATTDAAPSIDAAPSTAPAPSTEVPPSTEPVGPLVEVPPVVRRIDLSPVGLDVRYLDRANEGVAEGAVVSQDPQPGAQVPEGSLVVVVMSGGGPVTDWASLPAEARTFTDGLMGYHRSEPIRLVQTSAGEAYKTDAWLFGPCPAVARAIATVLDPSYDDRCYDPQDGAP